MHEGYFPTREAEIPVLINTRPALMSCASRTRFEDDAAPVAAHMTLVAGSRMRGMGRGAQWCCCQGTNFWGKVGAPRPSNA